MPVRRFQRTALWRAAFTPPAAQPLRIADTQALLVAARRTEEPVLLLAGGSNVVVGDDGFAGRVVLLRSRGVAVSRDGDRVRLRVAAASPGTR